MNANPALIAAGWIVFIGVVSGADAPARELPFGPEQLNRHSLDHLPRSISVRGGEDHWIGYDLERAKVYKVWRAPEGKPGLTVSGFVTRSSGTTLFEDKADTTWRLRRGEKFIPLRVRYLGCSHREAWIQLTWELRHDAGAVTLTERIPLVPASAAITRELRAESLGKNETLVPPALTGEKWRMGPAKRETAPFELAGGEWHQLTLP